MLVVMQNNDELLFQVTAPEVGTRLDNYLAERIDSATRTSIQKAILNGDCLVNERSVKPSYKIRAGDEIQIEFSDPPTLSAQPENIPLNIVYEDDFLIVVNKQAGMVVHPGAGVRSGTLANALAFHIASLSHQNTIRPGIIHRLDIGTSGLLVVAKTDKAHQQLGEQFADRSVNKHYTTLVYGQVKNLTGEVNAPIGRDPRNRVKMAVRPIGQGRNALTLYRVIERFSDFTLLDVEIKTGRTHQIRVHCVYINHPIVGDPTYDSGRGSSFKNSAIRAAIQKLGRPFLHSAQLSFTHPNGERMTFTAPLPDELQNFLTLIQNSDK